MKAQKVTVTIPQSTVRTPIPVIYIAIPPLVCNGAYILCNQTKHCVLQCSRDGCYKELTLFCGEECTIDATHPYGNAFYLTAHLPNTSNSSLLCNGASSCYGAHVKVGNNSIVNAQCNGFHACEEVTMDVSSSSSVDLHCEGSQACFRTTLNASLSHNTSLNITCYGDNTAPVCWGTSINGGVNSSVEQSCYGQKDCSDINVQCDVFRH